MLHNKQMERRRFIGAIAASAAIAGSGTLAVEEFRLRMAGVGGHAAGGFRPADLTSTSVVWRAQTSQKLIALSFDDGPDPRYTPAVLAELAKFNAVATFFMQGNHVANYPELARKVAANHLVGNHTYTHPDLSTAQAPFVEKELGRTHEIITRVTGQTPKLFRPPYGYFSGATVMIATSMGYDMVLWSDRIFAGDTAQHNVERLSQLIGPGAIVLGHDGGPLRNMTVVHTLPKLLSHLHEQGFQFVTVSELLRLAGAEQFQPKPDDGTISTVTTN
jgi:peptidoglycan-N-acetylglucosamine deacetylase